MGDERKVGNRVSLLASCPGSHHFDKDSPVPVTSRALQGELCGTVKF